MSGADRPTPVPALYTVVRTLVEGINRSLWRATFSGRENVPATGAYVLAPVHRSNIDFALVSSVTHRRQRYMGKQELWNFAPLGWFISVLGAYPVRRGAADREALNDTLAMLEAGDPVVLFPEGTRRSGREVGELFEGAAFVAGRAGVPIIPVGIAGSERALPKGAKLPRPVRVHLEVGAPIDPPRPRPGSTRLSRRSIQEVTATLRSELQRLYDQADVILGSG
ncbi:MAG: lysophospholipid acyltransferase family protein [Acidimicrobiales bacterium]